MNANTSNQSLFYRVLTGVRHAEAVPGKQIKQLSNRGHTYACGLFDHSGGSDWTKTISVKIL